MRIVLTVPEDKLREACERIVIFCKDHVITKEKRKEIEVNELSVNDVDVICDSNLSIVV